MAAATATQRSMGSQSMTQASKRIYGYPYMNVTLSADSAVTGPHGDAFAGETTIAN